MKTRKNVMVDEELLENARRMLGEKTNSGAIEKALEKVVRQEAFWEAYRKFETLAHTEGVFEPEYVQEKLAKSLSRGKTRMSAHEVRQRTSKRRGSR